MAGPRREDMTVRIVSEGEDQTVRVVGDQVVDLAGASPGDVLVVGPDGELTPAPPTEAGVAAHEADTTAAHPASAVSFTPSGLIVATDVQAALAELDNEKVPLTDARLTDTRVPTDGSVTNAKVAANAAIAKTKLAALDVVNADVNAAAAIAETKLALASDAAVGTASRRTLGPGALQAAPGVGPFAPTATGATAATRYVGGTATVAPTTGTFAVGDFVISQNGKIWICTVAGTPGTWVLALNGAYAPLTDRGWPQYNDAGTQNMWVLPGVAISSVATQAFAGNYVYYFPIETDQAWTLDGLEIEVTSAAGAGKIAHLSVYEATLNWQPAGLVTAPATTLAIDALGIKSLTGLATSIPAGRKLLAYQADATASLRVLRGTPPGGPQIVTGGLGANPINSLMAKSKAYAAFSDPGTAWDVPSGFTYGFEFPVVCRRIV